MYLGENQFTVQATTHSAQSTVREAEGMQSVPVQHADFPDGEGPCPCPPPQIIYKDRIVEKIVEKNVPGPTQIIYRDRYITGGGGQASGGGFVSDPSQGGMLPIVRIPAAAVDETVMPEDDEMTEGKIYEMATKSKFPWWMVAVGGGLLYLFGKKKKS